MAEKEHDQSDRQFAHVFHVPWEVCVSTAIAELPEEYLYGVLLHELGHIISDNMYGDDSEESANDIIEELTGIRIGYMGNLDLESIDPSEVMLVRGPTSRSS